MLDEGNTGRSFYAATRKLSSAATTPQWSVKDLFAGKEPKGVCGEVLKYFGGIAGGDQVDHEMPDIDRCCGQLPGFTVARTEDILKAAKKTDSAVKGDPLPHLVRHYPQAFATLVSAIFNRINCT